MDRKNIIVVAAISTGQFFIEDIIHRGYNPVVLKMYYADPKLASEFENVYASIPHKFESIQEQPDYEETLTLVKKYNPLLVLAGSEGGVVLATKLAADLGLTGNPVSILPAMTEKPKMHEALKKAGLRYIEGATVTSVQEGVDFYVKHGLKKAVVKPVHSAASQGLFFCDTKEDVEAAIEKLLDMVDIFGVPIKEVIIQKRIEGTEYIVNTVSCRGQHKLTSVLRYTKVQTKEGGNIYDYLTTVVELEPGYSDMISYAFKVADAIGYQYGEIHGEYIIDEEGAVLIEVNCRPMGGHCPPAWLNNVFGQHETDTVLDAYLEPEYFLSEMSKPYHPVNMAGIKFIMVPKMTEVESLPIYEIAKNLRSFHTILAGKDHTKFITPKTRDMETHGGAIYLTHKDAKVVEDDIKLLKEIEKDHFELVINDGESRPWFQKNNEKFDVESVIEESCCHGSILLVTDDDVPLSGVMSTAYKNLKEKDSGFKNVVIDVSTSAIERDESSLLKMIFDIMKRAQVGGRVIFTERCYYYLTGKKKGAETLLRVLGYRIEAPLYGHAALVIGTRV